MAATLTEVEPTTEMPPPKTTRKPPPDASQLEDRFPEWFRTTPRAVIWVAVLGIAFVFFNLRPLRHTDLWGHLAYGRLIVDGGAIPQTEPLMPLADGVQLIDTAWLSQILGYAVFTQFGIAGMQFLYATAITLCLVMLAWRLHDRTGNIAVTMLSLVAFLWVEWQAIMIVRPQLAGLCCFMALFVWLSRRRPHTADWLVVPGLMLLWVNLHGSFVLGLLLLGTKLVGRAVDVWKRTGNWRRVWRDRRTRRLLYLTELAFAATLLNPYGTDILLAPFTISANPNMAELIEWQPLTLQMRQGRAAFAVALLLILALRFSPRRVFTAEALLLAGLGAAALWSSRMLVWWAPVAVLSLGLHANAIWKRRFQQPESDADPQPTRSLWTFAAFGMVWIVFAFTPFGRQLLHGVEPKPERALSGKTPIGASQFLTENPPSGLVFNWDQWGDYLGWQNPRLKIFVNSHAHQVPRKVWDDYLNIHAGWAAGLDRYGVNTVVISPHQQQRLSQSLLTNDEWNLTYADERSMVFERKQPIGVEHSQ